VRHDGGIIDHHVDLAEARDDPVHKRFDAYFLAHIDRRGQRLRKLSELRGGRTGQLFVEVRDDDFGFLLRKGSRGVFADTLRATGDDDDLPL
jgi:hypothetical protein